MTHTTRTALTGAVASLLAATALAPLFATLDWTLPAVAAVAVVVAAGIGSRRLGVPVVLQPLVAAGALLLFVAVVFAPGTGLLGVLPNATTLSVLSTRLADGLTDSQELVAPVPANPGLVLLAVLGTGAVALLVDVAVCVLRRPSLSGVPLLAAYLVPAAIVNGGIGWVPFAFGATGYLTLLLTESRDRVTRWGRPLGAAAQHRLGSTEGSRTAAQTSPLVAVGRRIGIGAVSLAVVVPALLPGLTGAHFGGGGGGLGFGNGPSRIETFNPITKLKGDLTQDTVTPLLTIRSDDPNPGYVRMTSLDLFDGTTWSQSGLTASRDGRVSNGIPDPQGLDPATPTRVVRSEFTVQQLSVPWLPTYYPPRKVEVKGDWRTDEASRTIFSTRTDTRGLVYSEVSTKVSPTVDQLRAVANPAAGVDPAYLALPQDLPGLLAATLSQVTAGATTPYDKVVAIQSYFNSNAFTYSTKVPQGNSESALVDFLTNKQGYCEQFSAAMAVMVRALGIPARVSIGFTQGTGTGRPGEFLITTRNAHAWPEVYFPGAGWLAFEPTPAGPQGRAVPTYSQTDATPPTVDTARTPAPSPSASAAGDGAGFPADKVDRLDSPAAGATGPGAGGGRGAGLVAAVAPWLAAGLLVALLLAVLPLGARWATRRSRWRRAAADGSAAAAARAAWAELCDDLVDLGLAGSDSETPRGLARRLSTSVALSGPARAALDGLVEAEQRACYAWSPGAGPGVDQLRPAVVRVRSGLLHAVSRRSAVRATLLPTATIRRSLHGVGELVADALDRVDAVDSAVRRRLHRRAAAG